MLEAAQKSTRERFANEQDRLFQESRFEAEFGMMERDESVKKKKQVFAQRLDDRELELERQRRVSQMITRVSVIRDIVVKQIIKALVANEAPKIYPTPGFTIWIGKQTNMSNVHPAFVFPTKYIVPPDSPDDPTPNNPLTGFSFEYVEYKKNVYGWAPSTPPSQESIKITLIVMKANPAIDFIVENEKEPIRVFADMYLPSNPAIDLIVENEKEPIRVFA